MKRHYGVRTDRYKLIDYYTEDNYWELFDLTEDPNELLNLYGKPELEDLTDQLKNELEELRKLYGPSKLS